MVDYLKTVMHESQRLSWIVGNILDFSRMGSSRKTYEFQETGLRGLVRETLAEFDPVLRDQDRRAIVEVAERGIGGPPGERRDACPQPGRPEPSRTSGRRGRTGCARAAAEYAGPPALEVDV